MKYLKDASFLILNLLIIVLITGFTYKFVDGENTNFYSKEGLPEFDKQKTTEGNTSGLIRLVDVRGEFVCSAFVINDDYAITAGHCINYHDKEEPIQIYDIDNRDTGEEASVAAYNMRMDFGLIRGDFSDFQKLDVPIDALTTYNVFLKAVRDVREGIGHALLTCGFPQGAEDVCLNVTPLSMYGFLLMTDINLMPGMSGGPLIDPVTNSVIGINSRVYEQYSMYAPMIGFFDAINVKVKRD